MILVVAVGLLVLLVGVGVVGAATGLAGGRGERDSARFGAALAVPVAAGAVVVVLVLAVFGLDVARSGRGTGSDADQATTTAATGDDEPAAPPSAERGTAEDGREPVALQGPPARFDGRVSIDEDASQLRPPPIVGGVREGDVVEVRGVGFLEQAEGVVAQCATVDAPVCRNVAPILTDGAGRLRVPYRVEGPASGEVLVVEVDLDRGAARLAFGAAPTGPAVLTLTDTARVTIRGAPAGERVSVRRCEDGATTIDECPTVGTVMVGADGTASVPLDVGKDAAARLTLVDGAGNVLAEPVRIEARPARTEVDLERTQLLLGFSLALVLVGVAVLLLRTTDWRAPAEAATPFLDAAQLES